MNTEPQVVLGTDLNKKERRKILHGLCAEFSEMDRIRLALSASRVGRLRQVLESMVVKGKIFLAAALREAQRPGGPVRIGEARIAAEGYNIMLGKIIAAVPEMEELWGASDTRLALIRQVLARVQPAYVTKEKIMERLRVEPAGEHEFFQHCAGLFTKAIESGWPLEIALRLWAVTPFGAYDTSGCHFVAHFKPMTGRMRTRTIWPEPGMSIIIYILNGRIVQLSASAPIRPRFPGPRPVLRAVFRPGIAGAVLMAPLVSKFSPEACKVPVDKHGNFIEPRLRVGSLCDAYGAWERRLGTLSREVIAILRGDCVLPKECDPFRGRWLSNLVSWEGSPEAQAALFPVFATWANAAILEYVSSGDQQPLFILPLGAVPKSSPPWWRLITDGRPVNKNLSKWPSRCTSLSKLALMLVPLAFTSGYDIHDAFHISPVSGCTAPIVDGVSVFENVRKRNQWVLQCQCTNLDQPCAGRTWSMRQHTFFGCSPSKDECRGTCDKSLFGLKMAGHVYRIVSHQFGISTSQSVLETVLRPVVRNIEQAMEVLMAKWVDDLLAIVAPLLAHLGCKGVVRGCIQCLLTQKSAFKAHQYIIDLLAELNIPQSMGKGHGPAQVGDFTGVRHDTVKGMFYIPDGKFQKFVATIANMVLAQTYTPRGVAGLRGKVVHYCNTIFYLTPFSAALSVIIGTTEYPDKADNFEWDQIRQKPAGHELDLLSAEILRIITRWAPEGKPIWMPVASSLYSQFLNQDLQPNIKVVAVTFDASWLGYGVDLLTDPLKPAISMVGDLPPGLEQVHRESEAGIKALLLLEHWAAKEGFPIKGYFVIMRGDCSPALNTLVHGSYKSKLLQEHAMRFNSIAERMEVHPLTLHIPGKMMVLEGLDAKSREHAVEVAGPCLSPAMKKAAIELAERFGWVITFDLFASSQNAVVPRYASRFYDFQCEYIDAMLMPDWASSVCPHCSGSYGIGSGASITHPEICLAFLPLAFPLQLFVRKAQVDGFKGIVVIPAFRKDEIWKCIARAMVAEEPVATRVFRNCKKELGPSCTVDALVMVAVDFAASRPARSIVLTPPCLQVAHRRLCAAESPLDIAGRQARAVLQGLNRGKRSKDHEHGSGSSGVKRQRQAIQSNVCDSDAIKYSIRNNMVEQGQGTPH